MKVPTNTLIDHTLDWAVAKCEEYKRIHIWTAWVNKHGAHGDIQIMVSNKKHECYAFNPTQNWAQGGSIIEREKIAILYPPSGASQWRGTMGYGVQYGPTPLIAALRCYVASKLGDEVEIPEKLT